MRPIVVTKTGTGTTNWLPVDPAQAPFQIGFGCVTSGTVNYTVQHTFTNVQDSSLTATAFNHPYVAAQTANADGNYAFPVSAVRISVTSGSGSVTMTLLQGMRTA